MIIWVAGGREYDDWDHVRSVLDQYADVGNLLVEGGGRGLDYIARRIWTHEYQLSSLTVPARWNASGRAAGPVRNLTIAAGLSIAPHGDLKPELLLAFPGGSGTASAVKAAIKYSIPVVRA